MQNIKRDCLSSYHPKINVRGKRNEGERMEEETLKLKEKRKGEKETKYKE